MNIDIKPIGDDPLGAIKAAAICLSCEILVHGSVVSSYSFNSDDCLVIHMDKILPMKCYFDEFADISSNDLFLLPTLGITESTAVEMFSLMLEATKEQLEVNTVD